MDAVIQWALDNWEIFCIHWQMFISFGIVVCAATTVIVAFFYEKVLYKDIGKDKDLLEQVRTLQKKCNELTTKNDALEEERRKYFEDEIFLNGTKNQSKQTIGEIMADVINK